MDVSHLSNVIDIDALASWLKIQSDAGKEALKQKLAIWQPDINKLQSLSYQFASVKAAIDANPHLQTTLEKIFEEFAAIEPKLKEILEPGSEMEKESSSELIFLHHLLTPINFVPFALSIWSFVRVYLLPGMSLLMPIIMCIVPYILIRFMFGVPITFDKYGVMMVGMFSGDMMSAVQHNSVGSMNISDMIGNFITSLQQSPLQAIMKIGGVVATVVQTFIQPYMTYRHLSSIDGIITTNSTILDRFSAVYESLFSALKDAKMDLPNSPIPPTDTSRQLMAHALLNPATFKIAYKYIGQFEALWRISSCKNTVPVEWIADTVNTALKLNDTFDISVSEETRKTFSVDLANKSKAYNHALLTGPNRGGKSTALRALVMSSLLAHTYGCVIGTRGVLTPFKYIFAGLKADDIPGSKSHFEREVEFTARTIHMDGPTLVFVDELFHTTNPPDALESCRIYCRKLWERRNIVSVISTHLFNLVESSESGHVQHLCCPAILDSTGTVQYKYGVETGICKVSSVTEILNKYGFKCD